jgi:hypothetical protein
MTPIDAYAAAHGMKPAWKYMTADAHDAGAEYAERGDGAPDVGMRRETRQEFEARVRAAMAHRERCGL